jgi:hypothetical protein
MEEEEEGLYCRKQKKIVCFFQLINSRFFHLVEKINRAHCEKKSVLPSTRVEVDLTHFFIHIQLFFSPSFAMGWHHFTDHCCSKCKEPGGELEPCASCGCRVCDDCGYWLTEAAFTCRSTKRAQLKAEIQKEMKHDEKEDDEKASDSESDEKDEDDEDEENYYCDDCIHGDQPKDEEVFRFLLKKAGFRSKEDARLALMDKEVRTEIKKEENTKKRKAEATEEPAPKKKRVEASN